MGLEQEQLEQLFLLGRERPPEPYGVRQQHRSLALHPRIDVPTRAAGARADAHAHQRRQRRREEGAFRSPGAAGAAGAPGGGGGAVLPGGGAEICDGCGQIGDGAHVQQFLRPFIKEREGVCEGVGMSVCDGACEGTGKEGYEVCRSMRGDWG